MLKHKSTHTPNIVYSTGVGRMCPACGKPINACVCQRTQRAVLHGDGVVRVGRQTKGRRGKGVSVITGLHLTNTELESLCTQLKKRCGTGGTVKDGVIEIQGEHRDTLITELSKLGITAKKAGG